MTPTEQEFLKACLSLGVSFGTLAGTWLVGQRVVAFWTVKQKQRELQLALAGQFYGHYGLFRATWIQWNRLLDDRPAAEESFARRQALLDNALRAEGGIEAVLLKLASERRLSPQEQVELGNELGGSGGIPKFPARSHAALPWPAGRADGNLRFGTPRAEYRDVRHGGISESSLPSATATRRSQGPEMRYRGRDRGPARLRRISGVPAAGVSSKP